jgi:hypothetical protein
MKKSGFNVPVVFIIFNRPDTTRIVFEAIKQIKPQKFYVIADGPRGNNSDDIILCEETRNIVKEIDWECEKFFNFSDCNLGCGVRPSGGISWVFERESQAIILEDDCVPCNAFFLYCKEMLERYKDDARIMHINGSNFNTERQNDHDSYFFSRYNHVWGWATWKRAWELYDYEIKLWPDFNNQQWKHEVISGKKEIKFWTKYFNMVYNKILTSAWDYQWTFAIWSNNGLCITPASNLISNIGNLGAHANIDVDLSALNRPVNKNFRINKHPDFILRNVWYDKYHFRNHFQLGNKKRIELKVLSLVRWLKSLFRFQNH